MRAGEPDPDDLAALTGRPAKLTKAPAADPVLGLVTRPAVPEARVMHPVPPVMVTQVEADLPAVPAAPKKEKLGGYYAHRPDVERAQAAWKRTQLLEGGYPTWSDYQVAAIMLLTETLEAAHNGGEPFPPLPPGTRIR